jgi:hypothetical protein
MFLSYFIHNDKAETRNFDIAGRFAIDYIGLRGMSV